MEMSEARRNHLEATLWHLQDYEGGEETSLGVGMKYRVEPNRRLDLTCEKHYAYGGDLTSWAIHLLVEKRVDMVTINGSTI